MERFHTTGRLGLLHELRLARIEDQVGEQGSGRKLKEWPLPDDFNVVKRNFLIRSEQGNTLQMTLGNEQPVKRILTNSGQGINVKRMT